MYPSINNLAFTNTTNSLYNNNNSQSPNRNSSSYHPIHSSCIFHENNTSLQHFHDIPHKHDAPIVARNQSAEHNTTNTRMSVHQTAIDVLVKESPDDFFYNNSKKITRERSCKKDRHRKINTVHGPRYPRMRLSLDVAKNFFGLQDMLGFDKASNTVRWLLNKSDTAIKQLITSSTRARNVSSSNTTSISSTSISSECEVLSGDIEDSPLSLPREVTVMEKAKQEAVRENKAVITRECRNSRGFHSPTKETRERARARAREWTVEKRIRLGNGNYYNTRAKNVPYVDRMDENINGHSRSWSPQAADEEESSNRIQIEKNDNPSFFQGDHQEPASRSTLMEHKQFFVDGDHCLFNMPGSRCHSTSPFFNYHQNDAI